MIFQLARQMWAGGGVDFHIAYVDWICVCIIIIPGKHLPGSLFFSIEWVSLSNHPFCGDLDLHTALCCDAESGGSHPAPRPARSLARSPAVARHEFFSTVTQSVRGAVAFVSSDFWTYIYLCEREQPIFNAANQQSEFSRVIFHSRDRRPPSRFAAASPPHTPRGQKAEMHFRCFLFLSFFLPRRPALWNIHGAALWLITLLIKICSLEKFAACSVEMKRPKECWLLSARCMGAKVCVSCAGNKLESTLCQWQRAV